MSEETIELDKLIVFYKTMGKYLGEVSGKKTIHERLEHLSLMTAYALEFRKEMLTLHAIGIDMTPFHHMMKMHNSCKPVWQEFIDDPDYSEEKKEKSSINDKTR